MTLDVDRLRLDTPGCVGLVHMNNAGASLPTSQVVEAQKRYLDAEAMEGGYEALARRAPEVQRAYDGLAALLNCSPEEVAIVQSATTAWTQVFYGIQFMPGDRILTSVIEYGANYIAFLQMAQRTGVIIAVVPEDEEGDISIPDLERLIRQGDKPPVLIAITHVPTSSGRVYDAAAVGAVANKAGVPFLLDACQSVGQMPIDVQKIGCDWLTGTARKYLRGPRGTGFLYASKKAMAQYEPAMIDNAGATWASMDAYRLVPSAKRYEFYERNVAAVVGLGVALDYLLSLGQDAVWERVQTLAAQLRQKLTAVPGVTVLDRGHVLCGIVSFNLEGRDPEEVKAFLARKLITVWVSAIGSTRIDFERRGLMSVLRASVHYYNTEAELDQLAGALQELLSSD